jgi:RNA polymerase sigma-70 factor (family 1)
LLYVLRKEPAEEVVSDIFVKCWLDRDNLLQVQNPEVYLFVAVKNQALNYLKRFSHYHLVTVGEIDADEMINSFYPERDIERRELMFRMNQAIAMLPRQCQLVFKLIKEDGMKYKEVAEILHISPRTVQTQLFRAIAKLRVTLGSIHKIFF